MRRNLTRFPADFMFELAQTFYGVPDLYNAFLEHYTVIPADTTIFKASSTLQPGSMV